MPNILGISAGHDSGATLISDGTIVTAVNEERFSRVKHHGRTPFNAIEHCLKQSSIEAGDVDAIVLSSEHVPSSIRPILPDDVTPENISIKPISSIERFKYHYLTRGSSLPIDALRKGIETIFDDQQNQIPSYIWSHNFPNDTDVFLVNHHESHAATAYHGSGFDEALIVTLDGIGDQYSGSVWQGKDGNLERLDSWGRNGSLGWFFGIVTQALGWWIGNGEGKTMGLAAYGESTPEVRDFLEQYLPCYKHGTLREGYDFSRPSQWLSRDTHHWSFKEAEEIETLLHNHDRSDLAATAQQLLEEQVLEIVRPWLQETQLENIATAGGVFLNVKLNPKIYQLDEVNNYYIFPNAGDGGLPTGAAYQAFRNINPDQQLGNLNHAYWGPDVTADVPFVLDDRQLSYEHCSDIVDRCAQLLADGKILGWCQGRMEYGPRALGNRSILIDPTHPDSMDRVNDRVKFRDSWRPFAPSILEEAVDDYLVDPVYDPFMITSTEVREDKRDEIPAVTHVDGTTRPQVVRKSVNERYWKLINAFAGRTGTPVVLNTSFNLSGDPIVCDARDAIATFYNSGLDALAIGDYLLSK